MKIIVQYSGGKDSQATLLWAANEYGTENVHAVYCDTSWENPITYRHIEETTKDLGVSLTILKSEDYDGMIGLVEKKKRFPSSGARFCTEQLKIFPFLNYLLDDVQDHVLILQGIRAKESEARSKMQRECRYFKYYLQPYGKDKKGRPKYLTKRKKDVLKFISQYDDSILRPFFDATGQEVIDYILEHGQKPNPLYGKGYARVGCFPCIMSNHRDIKQSILYYPETLDKLADLEKKYDQSFFAPDYIPKRFCSKSAIAKKGKNKGKIVHYPTVGDVVKYLDSDSGQFSLLEKPTANSCMSLYDGMCE